MMKIIGPLTEAAIIKNWWERWHIVLYADRRGQKCYVDVALFFVALYVALYRSHEEQNGLENYFDRNVKYGNWIWFEFRVECKMLKIEINFPVIYAPRQQGDR